MKNTNTFQPKIGNEETAALPAIEYPGEIRVIEQEEEISDACAYLAAHPSSDSTPKRVPRSVRA